MKLHKYEKINGRYLLSVWERSFWGFGKKTLNNYIGHSTCWATYPDFKSCDACKCMKLFDIWNKITFEEKK
jgi:hypothetical protein